MFTRLGALLKKDTLLGMENYYLAIVLFVAILFIILVNFVIPKDTSIEPTIYYYLEPEAAGQFDELLPKMQLKHQMTSRDELIQNVESNINSYGMILKVKDEKPVVEYVLQGYENQKKKNLLTLPIRGLYNQGQSSDVRIEKIYLKDFRVEKDISFNLSMLPLLILFEPALLGLVLIATMVLLEKEEGTILSFVTTPGKISEFLASKVLFILFLSILSVVLITVFTVGFLPTIGYLLLIVGIGSIFSSSLGLLMASFFDNISKSMLWIVLISIVLTLPMISYFLPGFAPTWLKWIPTYPLLFAIKEAVFPTGNLQMILSNSWILGLASLFVFGLSVFFYRKNLSKT